MTVRVECEVADRGHLMAGSRFAHPIRISLIDDCLLYRAGVTRALSGIQGLELVGQGSSLGDILQLVYEQRPDIILLNVNAPGQDSSAVSTCCAICPESKIVVLAPTAAEAEVKAALRAGASGYIPKSVTGSELVATLKSIAEDEAFVTASVASQESHTRRLTLREQQIFNEVARGRSNKDIALRLMISEKTVKQHVTRMLQKLRVRNRVEAAMLGRKFTHL